MAVFMEPRAPSVAPSDTTYHSFHDVELHEPASPPQQKSSKIANYGFSRSYRTSEAEDRPTTAVAMKRQDSGYGSNSVSPRPSTSHSRPLAPRRTSTSNVHTGLRNRTRPSTRRSTKSYNVQQGNTSSLYLVRPSMEQHRSSNTFFHFPSPDPTVAAPPREPTPAPSLPPQTTHYWTSDRTRRLEYAAIDAAGRGVKGWVRRHLVPDCFVACEDKHVAFDDDTGSVRRYRLELEEEPRRDEKIFNHGHKGWQFWRHA